MDNDQGRAVARGLEIEMHTSAFSFDTHHLTQNFSGAKPLGTGENRETPRV